MGHLQRTGCASSQLAPQQLPRTAARTSVLFSSICPAARRQHAHHAHGVSGIVSRRSGALLRPQQHWQASPMLPSSPAKQHSQQQHLCQQQRHSRMAGTATTEAGDVDNSSSQQPEELEQLGHIDLPASRSSASWLQELSEQQLQQQAQDWGYLQVGRPLPEGLSLTAIADTIPEEHFVLDLGKAVGYLALSLGVMVLGYAYLWFWHSICPLWQQVAAWLVIGTGYFGVFQSAVDCAHFAFWPSRPLVQDLLGAALMAPALISYEVWRLKYFNHLMCTNQLYEDTDAWHPLLPSDLADLAPWRKTLLKLISATPIKFFSSIGQWFRSLEGFDLKLHPPETRPWVWLSWALPLGFIGLVFPAIIAAAGFGGLVTYWLGPWVVFHGWLSVLSLIQHTGPHIPWTEEGLTYDQAQATINGTVTLQLPNWLEVLLHHANYHLPAHVSISIPSYNLKGAQQYLQQRLGQYLTIAELNPQLLRNLMTAWLVYDEQQQRYVDFDQAEELVQQQQQQRRQQQQQQVVMAAAAADSSSSSGGGSGGGSSSPSSSHSSSNGTQSSSSSSGVLQQQQPHSSSPAAAFGL